EVWGNAIPGGRCGGGTAETDPSSEDRSEVGGGACVSGGRLPETWTSAECKPGTSPGCRAEESATRVGFGNHKGREKMLFDARRTLGSARAPDRRTCAICNCLQWDYNE